MDIATAVGIAILLVLIAFGLKGVLAPAAAAPDPPDCANGTLRAGACTCDSGYVKNRGRCVPVDKDRSTPATCALDCGDGGKCVTAGDDGAQLCACAPPAYSLTEGGPCTTAPKGVAMTECKPGDTVRCDDQDMVNACVGAGEKSYWTGCVCAAGTLPDGNGGCVEKKLAYPVPYKGYYADVAGVECQYPFGPRGRCDRLWAWSAKYGGDEAPPGCRGVPDGYKATGADMQYSMSSSDPVLPGWHLRAGGAGGAKTCQFGGWRVAGN